MNERVEETLAAASRQPAVTPGAAPKPAKIEKRELPEIYAIAIRQELTRSDEVMSRLLKLAGDATNALPDDGWIFDHRAMAFQRQVAASD